MTRRMLINAQTREELRVAIVDGDRLEDFQVEVAERGSTRGNIYRGVIARIEPSLNAAFIDYGAERHGFLAIQDVVPDAWYRTPADGDKKARIEEVLERNRPIVVQVVKEPEGQKGASLTTNLSFAGRYLVFTPFDEGRGVSRKVEDEEARRRLKDQVQKLEIPEGAGIIVRTAAIDQTKTSLTRDLAALLRLWKRVGTEARSGKGVKLIYSDQDLILQALRDYLDPTIEEILIDDDGAYERAEEYLKSFLPRGGNRLVRYVEREPLFSRYGLEPQIDDIHQRRVHLPSGGSIVIDRTEALTAIDVNSGRSTKAATQEQTALDTNLEAADAVARHLRLRDIGGLVVVDFIDMRASRNQKKVEKALRDAMKADKARSTVGRISDNGLLEINRQRIHQALSLRTHRTCPSCDGTGRVPSPEMIGLNLLRRIEARAATASLEKVRIALAPELAEAFQNGRRHELSALEQEFGMRVEIVASPRLNLREQEVEWVKREGGDARPAVSPIVPVRAAQVAAAPAEKRTELRSEKRTEPRTEPRSEPAAEAVAEAPTEPRSRPADEAQAEERPAARPERPPAAGGGARPEGAAAASEGSEEGGGGRRKRRRRRRRKRGGGGEEAAAAGGEAAPTAERAPRAGSPPRGAGDEQPRAGGTPRRGDQPRGGAQPRGDRPRGGGQPRGGTPPRAGGHPRGGPPRGIPPRPSQPPMVAAGGPKPYDVEEDEEMLPLLAATGAIVVEPERIAGENDGGARSRPLRRRGPVGEGVGKRAAGAEAEDDGTAVSQPAADAGNEASGDKPAAGGRRRRAAPEADEAESPRSRRGRSRAAEGAAEEAPGETGSTGDDAGSDEKAAPKPARRSRARAAAKAPGDDAPAPGADPEAGEAPAAKPRRPRKSAGAGKAADGAGGSSTPGS